MMNTAKVTQKGQVSIPKAIRELLGVGTGELVEFQYENGEVVLKKASEINHREADLKQYFQSFGLSEKELRKEMVRENWDDFDAETVGEELI